MNSFQLTSVHSTEQTRASQVSPTTPTHSHLGVTPLFLCQVRWFNHLRGDLRSTGWQEDASNLGEEGRRIVSHLSPWQWLLPGLTWGGYLRFKVWYSLKFTNPSRVEYNSTNVPITRKSTSFGILGNIRAKQPVTRIKHLATVVHYLNTSQLLVLRIALRIAW